MKMNRKTQGLRILSAFASVSLALSPMQNVQAASEQEYTVFINEIESDDASGGNDWIEIVNAGETDVDISGWFVSDDKKLERLEDGSAWRIPEGTVLKAGEVLVLEDSIDFDFGLGKADEANLYDKNSQLVDTHTWSAHASGTYSRVPDGTGEFVDQEPTKGSLNNVTNDDPEVTQTGIVLNEIESNGDATDWVEIYNVGTVPVDLTGWYILDNDPAGHAQDVVPLAEGTILDPGAYFVFEETVQFDFGLGKDDQVTLFNQDGVVIAEYAWTSHASGVYARIPDGTGEFVDFETSTKGQPNVVKNPVVLNEVQSNDPDGGPDWIELANPTGEVLDISGIVIKDDDDAHEYVIPEGTEIPANGFIVFTDKDFDFGLGKNDQVRLFENGLLIAQTTWSGHTDPTWGLYPDVNGSEYRSTKEATPGAANVFEGIPEVIEWPGDGEVIVYDTEPMFLEDASGLDFYNGQLYAVDNGTGKFWILDVAEDGTLSFAEGFENGKRVRFQKDADNAAAPGPDTEGITVDGEGFVYVASERDNNAKGVNYNVILKVDPRTSETDLVALQEWDLTASLPQVSANMGIEAVEWVSNADVAGKLFDQNTNAAFDAAVYPNAVADGVFFVALEDNGHVYAYVLNLDGSVVQIADIDSKLGGAMALDYDTYEKVLWVAADDGFGNLAAKVSFTGEAEPEIVHVAPPSGLDVARNNEGFAIAEAGFTKDGQRPVYRFADGYSTGALTIGSIACDYQATPEEDNPTTTDEDNPTTPDEDDQATPDEDNQATTDEDNQVTPDEDDQITTDGDDQTTTDGETPVTSNVTDGSAQTGDMRNISVWLVLALGSGLMAFYCGRKRLM